MTDSPRTSIGYDDTYSQVISQNFYYEDVTHNQTPQASDAIPIPSPIQEPPEKLSANEINPNINLPTHVKIYRTINTFKILALLLYVILWIYKIISNEVKISLNPSLDDLPFPSNYYSPSASYVGSIIMTLVFTLSIIFLVIELLFLFLTYRHPFIKKGRIIVSLLIFFIYLAFALAFNIIAGLGVLYTEIYSAMVTLLWIIPLLSLLEFFAGYSEWPITGEVTISGFIKFIKVILIFLYLINIVIKLVRFNSNLNSFYTKNALTVSAVGIINLIFEVTLFVFYKFQIFESILYIVKRVIFMLFFSLYFGTAFVNCYILKFTDTVYSIADGLIWVIVLCCFVEFIINEIDIKNNNDDMSFGDDNSQP
ncbi:13731_t:CDS:1 [Dentiscutata erythropus]|uniref:13731_t:CDS:1 n=1 Tax=Dentiscutata erythropus TaxID=1348616 RepID=A0A9N9JHB8_9GLOM|nr:13731_t:CDS:1 [Dentiscutata erythropus]